LKEKEEAKNTYDDAIASGHGAYLLEQGTMLFISLKIQTRKMTRNSLQSTKNRI
jgi:hypothetical protein